MNAPCSMGPGFAALGQVFHTWVTDPSTDFDGLIVRVFEGLRIFGDAER